MALKTMILVSLVDPLAPSFSEIEVRYQLKSSVGVATDSKIANYPIEGPLHRYCEDEQEAVMWAVERAEQRVKDAEKALAVEIDRANSLFRTIGYDAFAEADAIIEARKSLEAVA